VTDSARWTTNILLFGLLMMSALVGQSLIKVGLRSLGEFSIASIDSVVSFFLGCARNPHIWLGGLCVGSGFALWMALLSRMDLSQAVPLAAFSYIPWILIGRFVFGEPVGPMRIVGIFLITAGVICVGFSGPK
jgi:drug/metabolite transporter (DMT)-like permease